MTLLLLAIACAISFEISWCAGTNLAQIYNPKPDPIPGPHARFIPEPDDEP